MADAVVPIAKHHHAFFGRLLRQFLAKRAVQKFEGLVRSREHERHAESRVFGNRNRHSPLRIGGHIQRARTDRGHHRRVVAQLGRGGNLNFDPAGRFGLYHLSEFDRRLMTGVVRGGAVPQG
ncbi:hypothetical protein D3C78_1697510 [compost metagenome]